MKGGKEMSNANLSIQIIPFSQIGNAREMLNTYLLELMQVDPTIVLDDNGAPIYKWFDSYWTDKERYPIYLKLADQVIGFSLIRELDDLNYEIAEFYVAPNYRRNGYATWFAKELLKLFPGDMEISTPIHNTRAIKFWDAFSDQFPNHKVNVDSSRKNWGIKR